MEVSDEEGKLMVKEARNIIESVIKGLKPKMSYISNLKIANEKIGVFVTLDKIFEGKKELRGCIGFPLPQKPLRESLMEAAIASAMEDPRFYPVTKDELDKILVKVSLLTEPKLLKVNSPLDYPKRIVIGRDGLMVKWTFGSGLLLPEVPIEFNWNAEEFLTHACIKAGASPDQWLLKDTEIYTFQTIIFEELEPRGEVIRRKYV
ncbi:MAG: TIGR00296 family protein [Nitrososphaerales archaeon]